nr:retrovirus-related Pol polyprotein from transposon TNT 1-94 [Tanacetum cinerariifolium]
IGSPRADDHEYLMMLEDPYIEVALQAPPPPDYMPGPKEPEQAPPSPDYMDVKNAFLNGTLKDVFVSQPDCFLDPDFPNHVYRLKKALYNIKQAPRTWYDMLSSFLIDHHFTKGQKVHQSPRGIFISQSQYTLANLKKHGMKKCDFISTPMATARIDADLQGTPTYQTNYYSIIEGLMYLTDYGFKLIAYHVKKDSGFKLTVSTSTSRAPHFSALKFYALRSKVCRTSQGIFWQTKPKQIIPWMHTRASNSELVEPLPEPERTLNRRLRRRNKRVSFEQTNEPHAQPRVVYSLILNINHFCHFLDILENYNPIDDEPMWVADHVVAPTLGFAITIPETANEFAINGNHLTLVNGNQFYGRIKTDQHKHIHEFLRICDMFKYRDTKNEAVRLIMFPLSLTGEAKIWLDELNEGTIKT